MNLPRVRRHFTHSSPIHSRLLALKLGDAFRTLPLKLFRPLLVSLGALLLICQHVSATPVYLRPDSQFPSDNLSRGWLEAHTKRVQFQRWMRVETQPSSRSPHRLYGWVPEDHLVTALNLASEASLREDVPARSSNEMDAVLPHMIAKGSIVLILDVQGSWAQVNPLPVSENKQTWIPTEYLKALPQSQAQKAFVHHTAEVYVMPGDHARKQGEFKAGRYIALTGKKDGWLEIQYRGMSAWIKHQDAWILSDLTNKTVAISTPNAALHSAPFPYADLVMNLKFDMPLKVIESKVQRWGLVHVSQNGDLWWPISEDGEDDHELKMSSSPKVLTHELFARRIFDMATSTAIPSLKFVSAQGIFRTLDGQEWSKIPMFKDQNYPIAIAKGGPIFIGPYVSEDQGETFQTWIRYDKLVASLKSKWLITPKGLQIIEIRPQDASGKHIRMKLNIGIGQDVTVATEDQGLNWHPL